MEVDSDSWNGQLSEGAISRICFQDADPSFNPVLQVLEVRLANTKPPAPGQAPPERYRVILSDGTHYTVGMLGAQLNQLIHENQLASLSVICLRQYIVNSVGSKRIVMILDLSVLSEPVAAIGIPQSISTVDSKPVIVNSTPSGPPPLAPAPAVNPVSINSAAHQVRNSSNPYASLSANRSSTNSSVVQKGVPLDAAVIPIKMLNPYNNRWSIKARVTNKSQIRTWNNQRGTGRLFSIDLLDESDGEIRVSMFNDAVDKFYDVFELDKVYYISKGQVKLSNKQYAAHLNSDYEITLNADAEVVAAPDDGHIKKIHFDFVPVSKLVLKQKDSYVDILGVVSSVAPISKIMSQKTNKEITKRVLKIADSSEKSVELTLWGDSAEKYNEETLGESAIMAVKSCKVSDYGGCSLSSLSSSHIEVNPDLPEAHKLRNWWDSYGRGSNIQSISGDVSKPGASGKSNDDRAIIVKMKEECVNLGEQAQYFTVKVGVSLLKYESSRSPWYTACPSESCNKKVIEDSSGNWRCEKCERSYSSCQARYILSFQVSDFSDSVWMRAFNDQATTLLDGKSADELKCLQDDGDEGAITAIFEGVRFKEFLFTVRAKMEQRPDQPNKPGFTVLRCNPVDYQAESSYLLSRIHEYGF